MSERISAHFSKKEVDCNCGCGYARVNDRLVHLLEKLRNASGNKPITITSWCRCAAYNKKVGGAADSQHLFGMAADISIKGLSVDQVSALAEKVGFDGIGKYPKQNFVHVDVRGYPARWVG